MERFWSKAVVITGAASGIGEATARRFSREGAMVVLADLDADALGRVAADLPPERTRVQVVDVANAADIEAMIAAAIDAFARLDVLVNNAGIHLAGGPTDVTDDQWRKVMAVDLDAVFFGCRAAIPHLERTRGSIVNTASVSGLGGDWGMSAYNAAKGGVVNLTRALALDLGRRGIRVNAVCPTLTRTGMAADATGDADRLAGFEARIALGRICEPHEVAAVIAFLASDDASFVTGINMPVDGGLSASNGQPA
jgi:meso-butanediol dehydrogenase/(S,S)-butanediol dehydrogenase/diacetyl reductase